MSVTACAALISAAVVGCDSFAPPPDSGAGTQFGSTTTSAHAATTSATKADDKKKIDYSDLLLEPADLSDNEDTFTKQSSTPSGPDGLPGASALFVNQHDTRAITDTVVIYPDSDTAARTLRDALPTIDTVVNGATPRPAPVGKDGTMAVGMSTDGAKAATLLLFTEGPALVRLEFQSAPGDVTTDRFVIDIGKMQQIALRHGLVQGG
jgi:hypothetical protein